jgi:AcrR family transcriptional regulator
MGKKHAERQADIVQGTIDLCAEDGVGKITTQGIANRIGVAQATIFKHFKNRDEVFAAVLRWLSGQMFKTIEGEFKADASAAVRLQNIFKKQLNFANKNRALPRILFSDRLHSDSSILKSIVQNVLQRYIEALTALIEEGQQSGEFNPDINASQAAQHIAASIQGTLMRWSINDFNFDLPAQAAYLYQFNLSMLTAGTPQQALTQEQ